MTETCYKCRIAMVAGDDHLFTCPQCGYETQVFSVSVKELKRSGRISYLDGRHWNRGGGLNK